MAEFEDKMYEAGIDVERLDEFRDDFISDGKDKFVENMKEFGYP